MNKLVRIILNVIESLFLIGCSFLIIWGMVTSNIWEMLLGLLFGILYAIINESGWQDENVDK